MVSAPRRGYKMGCGVRPPQGLGIKAVVYEFLVFKIGESLFLQGDDNTYSTIIPLQRITLLNFKFHVPSYPLTIYFNDLHIH